ncbi:techylectin-5A-like [Amphibalanus amphitrite]|uniref:techylectin-5A-like n=1 Tax=Amphibalanus amphitrite TaxID=1232801 RepID=UPI001C915C97|nr:techylectin-5A-like [Amphibalanus amphitrite]
MSALSSRLATLLTLAVLIVTAGCYDGKSIPLDEYVQQVVRDELQSIVSTLQSGTERLENRLESRMEALERRMEELTGRLDSQQTQPDESQTSQLATRLNSQQSQLSELNTQLNEQKTTQSEVSVRMDNLTSQVDILGSKLVGAINNTSSQQERIDDLAAKVKQLTPPRDCSGLPVNSPSGVYLLRPSGNNKQPSVQSYCDMDAAGGNWTVIQRRDDIKPHQDFYLGWKDYKEGFGKVTKEFWWGLEHVYQLTSSGRQYELRVDLEAFDGNRVYVVYQGFSVSSELDGYRLSCTNYSGPAGDGLKYSVNEKFSTRDRDQDSNANYHCAQLYQGAWWYGRCGDSNLNGRHRDGVIRDSTGIWWWDWRGYESLKKVDMKIRPTY